MRVLTPLGEYPLEAVGIGRRGREVVICGRVAGLSSGLVLGPEDLRAAAARAARAAPALGALAVGLYLAGRLRARS